MTKEENEKPKQTTDAPPKPVKKTSRRKTAANKSTTVKSKEKDKAVTADTGDKPATKKTLYRVIFFYEWCKACGICSALCPKEIILLDDQVRPYIENEDNCIGCRNCEIHCPDFAITVKKRYPERRKTNGIK